MDRRSRSNIAIGLILLLLGVYFLGQQLFPNLTIWVTFSWPMIIMGVGVFLLLLGLLVGEPGLAVPASIVGGIGGILYWQNLTGNWGSWSYIWTLIPGFVGVGLLLTALLGGHPRQSLREGINLVVISLILFVFFFGLSTRGNWQYWPVALIALGVWILVSGFWRKRS